jgi:hypothetical protein
LESPFAVESLGWPPVEHGSFRPLLRRVFPWLPKNCVFIKPLGCVQNSKKSISASAPTIAGRVVGDCPGSAIAAVNDRRKKAAVLIFANDLNLLLVARYVTKGKRLAGCNSSIPQLVAGPVVSINVRQIHIANLFVRIIHDID